MYAGYQNMNLVVDDQNGQIWLGDIRAAFDKRFVNINFLKRNLYAKNIKTVITAASGIVVSYPTNKITHHVYQMQDRENFDISRFFDRASKDIAEGLTRGPGNSFYLKKSLRSLSRGDFPQFQLHNRVFDKIQKLYIQPGTLDFAHEATCGLSELGVLKIQT